MYQLPSFIHKRNWFPGHTRPMYVTFRWSFNPGRVWRASRGRRGRQSPGVLLIRVLTLVVIVACLLLSLCSVCAALVFINL